MLELFAPLVATEQTPNLTVPDGGAMCLKQGVN